MNTQTKFSNWWRRILAHTPTWIAAITLPASQLALAAATPINPDIAHSTSATSDLEGILCIWVGVFIVFGAAQIIYLQCSLDRHATNFARLLETALKSRPEVWVQNGSSASVVGANEHDGQIASPALEPMQHIPAADKKVRSDARNITAIRPRRFRLMIAKNLLTVIHQYITDFLAKHGDEKEAGGMLVGEYISNPNSGTATFQIQGFIDAGPNVEASAGSILFDADYQTQTLHALQLEHPRAVNLGCIHRQPGDMDTCSGGDALTDREAVKTSDTKALVFAIITLNNNRCGPSSLFHEGLKIDFYLMAEETKFEYVPIKPELVALPLLQPSPVMCKLVAARGSSVTYDLAILRQLPGVARSRFNTVETAAGSNVVLTVGFSDASDKLHVWIQPSGEVQAVLQDQEGQKHLLPGPWGEADVGRHVWLSHLALLARARSTTMQITSRYGRHFAGLLDDKRRLVAEVRAMQERVGDRAVLRRRGHALYWDYIVRESGRQFPVEIQYPDSYPVDPPRITSSKSLPPSPHQLGNNELCWTDVYSGNSDWNPSRDTAVICINAAHRWFACLLIYLTTAHWPKGADH